MAYEVEGKLHKIYPTENKSASFAVREFVVEVPDGQYPQYIKFQAVQERTNILDNFHEGDRVKVSFDLRGRAWQDKFFTTLNCWRIDKTDGGDAPSLGSSSGSSGSSGGDMRFPDDPFPSYTESQVPQPKGPSGGGFEDLPF